MSSFSPQQQQQQQQQQQLGGGLANLAKRLQQAINLPQGGIGLGGGANPLSVDRLEQLIGTCARFADGG